MVEWGGGWLNGGVVGGLGECGLGGLVVVLYCIMNLLFIYVCVYIV